MTNAEHRLARNVRRSALLAALVVGITGAAATSAQAATVITNPWAGTNTTARIGRAVIGGTEFAVAVFRSSGGHCQTRLLGEGGLSTDYVVSMGDGHDTLTILRTVALGTFCEHTNMGPLNDPSYNGHYLDVQAGAGDDTVSSGTGDTWMWGHTGWDILVFQNPTGQLDGFTEGDVLVAQGASGNSESLFGGDGDDCLENTWGGATVLDCGNGFDTQVGGASSLVSCENTRSQC